MITDLDFTKHENDKKYEIYIGFYTYVINYKFEKYKTLQLTISILTTTKIIGFTESNISMPNYTAYNFE